ncbi:hypothetical protein [Methylomonas koyamae]|uniref:hypothetical protein n=1 Tax=Methylomonas koyamae TaxID=702114 RepID=UPI0011285D17|nr:hypothetical protein [Methylomonas koyamae]TPQ29027.1 hypothetical protein C2U68_03475 [Methylomonas koyamae]
MKINRIGLLLLFFASINANATQQISYTGHIISSEGSVANIGNLFSGQFLFNPEQPDNSRFNPDTLPYTEWEGDYWNNAYLSTAITNKFSFVSNRGIGFAFQDNRDVTQAEIDLNGFHGVVNQGNYDVISFEAINLGNDTAALTGSEFSITALFDPSQFGIGSFQTNDLKSVFQTQPLKFGYQINKVTNGLMDFRITGLIDSFSVSDSLSGVALPTTPVLPVSSGDGFSFDAPPQPTLDQNGKPKPGGFYDPDVAVAYTYEALNQDTLFGDVMIPNQYGDGKFELLIWDETSGQYVDSGIRLLAGVWFNFGELGFQNGIGKFRIAGIETSAVIDPGDPLGFVTGLTFTGSGSSFKMTPLSAPVPAPAAFWLFGSGLLWLMSSSKRGFLRAVRRYS